MFKVMRALRPRQSKNLVYIMKNFSTLEGQKIFDDCYEQYVEQPYETTINFYQNRGYDSRYFRLAEYFYNEEDEWVMPMTLFPRINFEKSKMHLAFEPYELGPELVKEAHDKIFKYLMKLDIKRVFMPKADVLQKHGNQKYNDGGIVRYDYERPTISFDSSFKYQRFLTQPLTPREVWLPGKAIKQNNVFFMQLHRQFLKADPVYPSPDSEVNHERIKKFLKDGFLKFDISGFGFQYLRELLKIGNRCIQELYPCTTLDEQCEIFERILDNVKVEMPDGTFKYPQRGIGLGYYEDLKTIVMLALLDHLDPISVYGDQGLLPPFALSFAEDLQKFQFIMNWEKIDFGSSEGKTKWGGCSYTFDELRKPRLYSENIIGSFFSTHHWERKLGLYGFYKHYPKVYKSCEKRLRDMYELVFGYEFFEKDSHLPFDNGGLSSGPRAVGYQRLWWIRGERTPRSSLLFDTTYQTPFKTIGNKTVTFKESRDFQKKRKRLYRMNKVSDTTLYDYINPKIEYNKKDQLKQRVLPRWADFNLIIYHNMSSGSITCGLDSDNIKHAVSRQVFASDPLRARATGGYSIETNFRSGRPPSQEWVEIADVLSNLSDFHQMYVNRTDLHQDPSMGEDPMYYNDNLFRHIVETVNKRKRPVLSSKESNHGDRILDEVRENLPHLLKRAKVTNLPDIIQLAEKKLEEYDKGYNVAESDHGHYEDDELFYADDFELIDLDTAL
jgi:hypothetical protein